METLILNSTEDTPKIILDYQNNIYEISGRSLPEDVIVFYQPVMEWIEKYADAPNENMNFDVKLEYFNTASSKIILDILMKLEEIKENGANITVKWHYDKRDEDMMEAGEEYAELVSLEFELVGY